MMFDGQCEIVAFPVSRMGPRLLDICALSNVAGDTPAG
jgi:hypothetical protein